MSAKSNTMTELNWTDHKTQLNRQLAWQTVRNEFYNAMMSDGRRVASARRALDHASVAHLASPSISMRESRQTEVERRSLSAEDLYYHVVCQLDQRIKQSQRAGDADGHRALLDEANAVLRDMLEVSSGTFTYDHI